MISQNFLYAETKADLYANLLPDGWFCVLIGETVRLDTPSRLYLYNGSSTATDDTENVIKPTAVSGAGRWVKTTYQQLQANYTQATTSALDYVKNKPTASVPSITTPGRTLSTTGSNNTFTISTTRTAIVSYTVNFSASLTLGTSNGSVDLDYSLDGGSTWINVASVSQVFGLSITITTNQSMVLMGVIPINALVRINRSNNSSVTISLTARQQETLL